MKATPEEKERGVKMPRRELLLLAGLVALPIVIDTSRDKLPSPTAPALLTRLREPRPTPSVAFEGADGAAKTFGDFRAPYLLVNIWATWCPSCRKEMPSLDRLKNAWAGVSCSMSS